MRKAASEGGSVKVREDFISSLIGLGLGLYWIVMGIIYGFWEETGPASGFTPVVFGLIVTVSSVALFWQSLRSKKDKKQIITKKELLDLFKICLAVCLVIFCIPRLGTFTSLGLLLVIGIKLISSSTWLMATCTGAGITVILYLVFKVWLMVPLPQGLLGF